MIWEDLNENLIVPDLEAENSEEVFEKLGGLFIAEGYCRDTYVDALKEREKDFELYSMIETLAPKVIADERKIYKGVSANVDFYSGFVYSMLDIPLELFTPIFAMARIVGWSAHRLEELTNVDKIIRPAYQSVQDEKEYIEMEDR